MKGINARSLSTHELAEQYFQVVSDDVSQNQTEKVTITESSYDGIDNVPAFMIERIQEVDSREKLREFIESGKTTFTMDKGIEPNKYQVHVRTMPFEKKIGDLHIVRDKGTYEWMETARYGTVINVGPDIAANIQIGDEIVYPEKFGTKYPGIENPYGSTDLDAEVRTIQSHFNIDKILAQCVQSEYVGQKVPVQMSDENEPKEREILDWSVFYDGLYKVAFPDGHTWTDANGETRVSDAYWVSRTKVKVNE